MKMNNNKSLLIASLLCTIGAALVYTFKWVKLYFMSASLWQVSGLCSDISRYFGMQGYGFLAILISGGAIISLVLLLVDMYIIARPLINGMGDPLSARRAKGRIFSIIYVIGFTVMVYMANDSELDGASITLWPVVSAALSVVAGQLLRRLRCVSPDEGSSHPSQRNASADEGGVESRREPGVQGARQSYAAETAEVSIPVVNYSASSPVQLCQVNCDGDGRNATLLIACYTEPEVLKALRVRFTFVDAFGDSIDGGALFFGAFNSIPNAEPRYLRSEAVQIAALHDRIREIVAVQATIEKVSSADDAIQVPTDYEQSPLDPVALKALKAHDMDAVWSRESTESDWRCVCGRINAPGEHHCQRCGRRQSVMSPEALIEALDSAADCKGMLEVLDEAIQNGMTELKDIRFKLFQQWRMYGVANKSFYDIGSAVKALYGPANNG